MSSITRFNDDSYSSLLQQFLTRRFKLGQVDLQTLMQQCKQRWTREKQNACKKIKHTFDSCKRSHPLRVQHLGHLSVFYDEIITRMQSCNMSTTWAKCIYSGRSKPCDKVEAYCLTWQKQCTVQPRLTATLVIRSPHYYGHFFWPPGKNNHTFSCKETLINTVTSLLRPNFLGPLLAILMGFHCMLEPNGTARAHFLPSVIFLHLATTTGTQQIAVVESQ